ncbi:hypothetical protein PIB30_056247 [Stylosanthes scabra]|uniref:Uncharacterized protein n=1 Tax=Stylosanthes scabra TaxID=79078 RepID=A0ABU6VIW7_9FABA|nr:hypothetical protein [Stylosanthes scabra]
MAGCSVLMNSLDPTTNSEQILKHCIGSVAPCHGFRVKVCKAGSVGGKKSIKSVAGSFGLREFEQLFEVVQSTDPGPTADFIQWWILTARRYLVLADYFHRLPLDEIPVEATQRQSGPHPARPVVPHVPDNRRPGRRMMVGTRTIARNWQWLEDMMAEDVPATQPTQKIRSMPETYARRIRASRPRRGGRASRGRGEGGDAAPTQQTHGGASTSQAVEQAGTSSQAYLPSTPQTQGTTIPSSMNSPSQ